MEQSKRREAIATKRRAATVAERKAVLEEKLSTVELIPKQAGGKRQQARLEKLLTKVKNKQV